MHSTASRMSPTRSSQGLGIDRFALEDFIDAPVGRTGRDEIDGVAEQFLQMSFQADELEQTGDRVPVKIDDNVDVAFRARLAAGGSVRRPPAAPPPLLWGRRRTFRRFPPCARG